MGYLGTKPSNSPLTSELIPDGIIATSDIATNAVTSDKITSNAVTEAKLASGLYTAKAWVNFNGTGTVAIRASGNVSSITDIGVGRYQVNFTNAFADTNYAAVFGAGETSGGGSDFNYGVDSAQITTSSIRATYFTSSGAAFADTPYYTVACFR